MPEPLFQARDISVTYNQRKMNEVRALKTANLDILSGEYVIIYGPSGCGKSTLLYSLAALQVPSAGDILYRGAAFSTMTKKEKLLFHQLSIGMVFQAFHLIPSLTILDNVCLPRVFRNEKRQTREEAGKLLLRRFGIPEQAYKYPSELSGGQKQRVAIARALINDPDVILADEPVGNLDSVSTTNVLAILKELNEVDKKTVILVTHDPNHLSYSDRVIYMQDGKIISEETNVEARPYAPARGVAAGVLADASAARDLQMLLHSFDGLPKEYIDEYVTAYKAKQLMFHILSDITDEQSARAEDILHETLLAKLDLAGLQSALDRDPIEGGAGWNKSRAHSFAARVEELSKQADHLKQAETLKQAIELCLDSVRHKFQPTLTEDQTNRVRTGLKNRLENTIDRGQLALLLDTPLKQGGAGLHKSLAQRIANEIEMILLLKY